jgi:hypothetical protein
MRGENEGKDTRMWLWRGANSGTLECGKEDVNGLGKCGKAG